MGRVSTSFHCDDPDPHLLNRLWGCNASLFFDILPPFYVHRILPLSIGIRSHRRNDEPSVLRNFSSGALMSFAAVTLRYELCIPVCL